MFPSNHTQQPNNGLTALTAAAALAIPIDITVDGGGSLNVDSAAANLAIPAAALAIPTDITIDGSGSLNVDPASPAIGVIDNDSGESQNDPSVSSVIERNRKKFPTILFNPDNPNTLGLRIIKIVFDRVESAGGWNECFGHGKKHGFLNKTLDIIFEPTGQANE